MKNSAFADPLEPTNFKVTTLIRSARGTATQKEFGTQLGGVSQSQLCKYESGMLDPPSRVIEECMRLVASRRVQRSSPEHIAIKLRKHLARPELAEVALAFGTIIDALGETKVGRPKQQAR